MDMRLLLFIFALVYFVGLTLSAPVDQNAPPAHKIPGASENEIEENVVEVQDDKKVDTEIDDLGLEYGRYLQEVVKVLDEDPTFAKKMENITHDQIVSGQVARQIELVAPEVRNRLDELKRIELDRLRKLAMKEHQLELQIEQEQQHPNGENNELDGRKWRTLHGGAAPPPAPDGAKRLLNKASLDNLLDDSNASHLDHSNPHSFEAEDLHRLIMKATQDLEELDRKRRRDFKQYEMEKEIHYRESLQNMTAEQRTQAERKHEEEKRKHQTHPHVNHPGSKQQLEQVWEEQDHMSKQEFNPKIFFQMHDINGDGFLDQEEVEALLSIEVQKLYNDKDPSIDKNEMNEEYHRMREHIYKEIDANHDGLISRKEFLDYTKTAEFEKDEGWKGIEEAPVYTEEELKRYEQQRLALQDHYAKYGAYPQTYQQGMEYAYQPVYYQVQHPGQAGQHGGQPVQYVVNMPPEHIQQPVQYHHVELPPQHQQQHPAQGYMPQQQQQHVQYQALPPAQHQQQQQQYGHVNQQYGQYQQIGQQQHQQQQYQQHPSQQQQQYHPPPPPQQQHQQQPNQQQQYHPAPPPPQQQQQQQQPQQPVYNAVPPQQQQQYSSTAANQQHQQQQQQPHPK